MASYDIAYKITARNEGGWVIDQGGWTYLGMSIKGHPNWDGWKLIRPYIAKNGIPRRNTFFPNPLHTILKDSVYKYFKKYYWDRMYGDLINLQEMANFCFDFVMNSGQGFIEINKAIGVRVTNRFNEDTLKAVNERTANSYLLIYNHRRKYFNYLATLNKLNRDSLPGWINRINKYPADISHLVARAVAKAPWGWAVSVAGFFLLQS